MILKINVFTDKQYIFDDVVDSIISKVEVKDFKQSRTHVATDSFIISRVPLNDSARGIKGHFSIVDGYYEFIRKQEYDMTDYIIANGMYANKELLDAMAFMDKSNGMKYREKRGKAFSYEREDLSIIIKAIEFTQANNKVFSEDINKTISYDNAYVAPPREFILDKETVERIKQLEQTAYLKKLENIFIPYVIPKDLKITFDTSKSVDIKI